MSKSKLIIISLFTAILFHANAYAESHVDCSTAEADIAHLEHEKKSTDERIAKGVFSILPIGIALNAAQKMGESDAEEMKAEEYAKQLDSRIAEIKNTCGL